MGFLDLFKRTPADPSDEVVGDINVQERQLKVLERKREEFADTLRIIRKNIKDHQIILDKQGAQDLEYIINRLVAKSSDSKSVTFALQTAEDLSRRILKKKHDFSKQDINEFASRLGPI